MLKILEGLQSNQQKIPDGSKSEDILNIMKNLLTPQTKQVSNIIVSSNLPSEQKNDENEEKAILENQTNVAKSEEKSLENSTSESFSKNANQNTQISNDFLFLSKVATMCNQMNDEEKVRKEKKDKDEDEDNEGEELRFKSKKMYFLLKYHKK